ncbi:uncharacterized protein LOC125957285 [Anopheles darlingi]|uniref:uncharacterized protein LOC125957285 n=1 Tax=Anopheles darlingi TaxID=43151 RepID=UPI0021001E6F|nr:uncharacterized protein LOC125957285 [Anopheles darlingi]
MQMRSTIMRLVVILSVSLQIYANTVAKVGAAAAAAAALVPDATELVMDGRSSSSSIQRPVIGRTAHQLLLPRLPGVPFAPVTGAPPARTERNVYRTKLSKLRLILLADMLNEMPPPQLELITCLANSSTLNVTTKHCDCETYSCKDVLASSSPPPLNQIQSKRKIHTSCRDHCCRKKKFNRSIDPATLENVAASHRPATGSTVKRLSSGVAGPVSSSSLRADATAAAATAGVVISGRRTETSEGSGLPSTLPRDDRSPAAASECTSGGLDQISISNGEQRRTTVMPWLYRVGLIETKHPVCVGALIHPSLILTTAVCVINKKPEELVVWNDDPLLKGQPMTAGVASGGTTRQRITVSSIILPDQFATTFERLENNVALLVLGKPTEANDERQPLVQATQGLLRAPEGARKLLLLPTPGESWRRRSSPVPGTLWRRKRTQPEPVPICLSSIIEPRPTSRSSPPPKDRCFIVSPRRYREASSQRQQKPADGGSPVAPASSTNDGTNYVTTNISIFPATECRPEHRDYLQHDGNLCAGYGAASNRSIDVDYSGAPLICDESVPEAGTDGVPGTTAVRRTIRGLLTWSTDINHAPHLFTNLTTYRGWIERTIEQLGQRPAFSVQRRQQRRPQGPPAPPAPITMQSDSPSFAARGQPSVVLYG